MVDGECIAGEVVGTETESGAGDDDDGANMGWITRGNDPVGGREKERTR